MNLVLAHWSFDPAVIAAVVALFLEAVGYRNLAARRAAISGRGMGGRTAQAWLFDAAWVWWRLSRLGLGQTLGRARLRLSQIGSERGRRVSRVEVCVGDWLVTVGA